MAALLIGPDERAKIVELLRYAAAKPLDAIRLIAAAHDDPAGVRDMMALYSIALPVGFCVTYSVERQTFGLCRHISISVDRPGTLPHPEMVTMILKEFAMAPIEQSIKVWVEDAGPTKAVNIAQSAESKWH